MLYNHNNNYTLKMIWQMDKGMPKLYNANILLQITGRLFINSAFILVAEDTIQFINTDKILKFAINSKHYKRTVTINRLIPNYLISLFLNQASLIAHACIFLYEMRFYSCAS